MRLGESRRVPITNVGNEVDSRKVGIEGGAFIDGGRGGGGFILRFGWRGGRWLGSMRVARGGSAYPM